MMRIALVALLFLGSSTLAFGQSQADDDEKPGSRKGAARGTSKVDDGNDSDTPTHETSPPPPSIDPQKRGAGTTEPADRPALDHQISGDSPVRLKGGHVGWSHAEGRYAGVSLGGEHLPPKAPKLPLRSGPQRMTWPGFQVRDGVPTVFLQTTGAPNYTVVERTGAVIVTLRNTSIKLHNNTRELKVADFGTDVTGVQAKAHGHDVIVTISRKGEGHRERVEQSAGGFQLLVVELPPK